MSGSSSTPRDVKFSEGEARGPVLDTLRSLLAAGEHDKVVGLVSQLLLRNGELEKKLAKVLANEEPRHECANAMLQLVGIA